MSDKERATQILILATEACAYPGANSVGQAHTGYAAPAVVGVAQAGLHPGGSLAKVAQSPLVQLGLGRDAAQPWYPGAYISVQAPASRTPARSNA